MLSLPHALLCVLHASLHAWHPLLWLHVYWWLHLPACSLGLGLLSTVAGNIAFILNDCEVRRVHCCSSMQWKPNEIKNHTVQVRQESLGRSQAYSLFEGVMAKLTPQLSLQEALSKPGLAKHLVKCLQLMMSQVPQLYIIAIACPQQMSDLDPLSKWESWISHLSCVCLGPGNLAGARATNRCTHQRMR